MKLDVIRVVREGCRERLAVTTISGVDETEALHPLHLEPEWAREPETHLRCV